MLRIIIIIVLSILGCIGINVQADNPHEPVRGLGISPNFLNDKTLFLSTNSELTAWRYDDILRSTDGGATWTKLPRGVDNNYRFSSIRVSPHYSSDQTVFAATLGNGVYQSSNGGNSWKSINSGLSTLNIAKGIEIAKTGGTDYVLFLNPGSGNLYRRFKAETSWTLLLAPVSGVNLVTISPDFVHDTTVMTLSINGNLQISTDAGNNWIDKGNPTSATTYSMAIAPGNAREIFLATNTGIFYSDDSGNTFTNKSGNLPAEAVNNIVISPNYLIDNTLFCTTVTQAVFKSTDGGSTWTFHDTGATITGQTNPLEEFSELQTSTTFATDQTVFLSSYDGLRISTDGGSNWIGSKTRENLFTGLAFSPHFIADQSIIATTYHGGGTYTSIDKGASWAEKSTGWFNPFNRPLSAFDVDFVQNHIGSPLAVASLNHSQVGFSSDFGENWSVSFVPQFPDIAPGNVYITTLALSPDFDSDHEIYLGTRTHGVLQTVDGGISWRSIPDVSPTREFTSVAVSPNYANDKIAFAANHRGEIWRTQNGGDNWSRSGSDSIIQRPNSYVWIAISPAFATDRLVLIGTNNGIYRSGDKGNTWKPLLNRTIGAGTVIQQIEFSPNFVEDRLVYVTVRGKGLYRLTFDSKGWIALSQNVGAELIKKNIQFTEFRISPSFKEDHTLLGASRESFYISIDGGLTWVKSGSPGQ